MCIIIKSEQLVVEIAKPGDYAGPRFDWSGFINQVTLANGNHTFCAPESLIAGAGTGGIGLCNEFGIEIPIGYEGLDVDDYFPKVGVGLLKRTDNEPYDFFKSYPVQPFPIHYDQGPDYVRFTVDPIPHNGYACKLEKEIKVVDATLTIHYVLHNVGEKPLVTNEYVHNFISIDQEPVGPDYVLHFPEPLMPSPDMTEYTRKALQFNGNSVEFVGTVQSMLKCRFPQYKSSVPYYWELIHKKAGAGVRERGSAPTNHIVLWSAAHVLSPEVFVDVIVQPGESQQWSRSYDFFTI